MNLSEESPEGLLEHPIPLLPDAHQTLDTIQEGKEWSTSSESKDSQDDDVTPNLPAISSEKKPPNIIQELEESRGEEEKKTHFHLVHEDDDDDEGQEREYAETSHPDVDGGWAWVVMFSIFAIFTIISGGFASSGLYYSQMLKEFGHSRSYTAWMGSLLNSFFMLIGPISSVVVQKLGVRASMIVSGLAISIGYLASAFAPSLPFLFISYGVVVAGHRLRGRNWFSYSPSQVLKEQTQIFGSMLLRKEASGMNLCYYGQIIALAQYFTRRHSLATSFSMMGIGVGVFLMVPLLELLIEEYGWRGSFIIYAGISLQVCVFSCLIFPIRVLSQQPPRGSVQEDKPLHHRRLEDEFGSGSFAGHYGVASKNRAVISQHVLLNRSVSSFKLSLGAGYLSSSIISLNDSKLGLRSNQHSFCSRGSHFATGIMSHQASFCHRDSHQDIPFLKSNQHSFCSRGSYYGIQSLRSIGNSFSIRNSHDDLHHMQPRLSICSKDTDIESAIRGKRYFHVLNNRECNLSACKEDHYAQNAQEMRIESTCNLVLNKIACLIQNLTCLSLMVEPQFWLLNFTVFFSSLATINMFVVYKDLCSYIGFADYYSKAIAVVGIGDVCGRFVIGVITSFRGINPILCYAPAMIFCGLAIGLHLLAPSVPAFIAIAALFGLSYGGTNILFAVVPSAIFGKEKLVVVFGYALFASGLGALVGAPLDGFIVDKTGSYEGVVILSIVCCAVGAVLMTLCFFLTRRKDKQSIAVNVGM